jgi:hypothetical protein
MIIRRLLQKRQNFFNGETQPDYLTVMQVLTFNPLRTKGLRAYLAFYNRQCNRPAGYITRRNCMAVP